jgi:hypothetical protein
MPRNISFFLTTPQFIAGTKDVTRRMGWLFLKPGDILMAVEKSQGLGKGGKVKRLGEIRVVSVDRQPLYALIDDYDMDDELRREGFPEMTVMDFINMFCASHKGCTPESMVTRIEFERLK